jgi:cytoskeletal protein CcmA (bactofilin family)
MTDVYNELLAEENFDTVISPDIDFSGTVISESTFLIKGKVSGNITAKGRLAIDEGGIVEAKIRAESVIIRGAVRGDVTADEEVEISATGSLNGNLKAEACSIERGGVFHGRCDMGTRVDKAP